MRNPKTPKTSIVVFDAGATTVRKGDGDTAPTLGAETIRVIGYRQTIKPAVEGGKANYNSVRVRKGSLRRLARSFTGQPFISGHEWGDVEARIGTITKCTVEDTATENLLVFDIALNADGRELLADGKIDRFSVGMHRGEGDMFCTLHKCKVFSIEKCWCCPGEKDEDGNTIEWEFQEPDGLELSAVNVAAVMGTGIVQQAAEPDLAQLEALALLAGQPREFAVTLAARIERGAQGGFAAPASASNLKTEQPATKPEGKKMNREDLIKLFGLPADATDEQIAARSAQLAAAQEAASKADAARLSAETQLVETRIDQLKAKGIADDVLLSLREQAKSAGIVAFNASFDMINRMAPAKAPVSAAVTTLQSTGSPAPDAPLPADDADDFDPVAKLAANKHANRMLRAMSITLSNGHVHRLTMDDVAKYGPRKFEIADDETAGKFRNTAR